MSVQFGDSLEACSVWENGQANLWRTTVKQALGICLCKPPQKALSISNFNNPCCQNVRQWVSGEIGKRLSRSRKLRRLGCCLVLVYIKQTNTGFLEDSLSPSPTAWKATLTHSEETTSEKPDVLWLCLHCGELGLRQQLMQTTSIWVLTDRKMTKLQKWWGLGFVFFNGKIPNNSSPRGVLFWQPEHCQTCQFRSHPQACQAFYWFWKAVD